MTEPDAHGWLSIDSAPRDGTLILATSTINHNTYVVGWQPGNGDWHDSINGEDHWSDVGSKNAQPALYFSGRYFTHWQPLPPPPVAVARGS